MKLRSIALTHKTKTSLNAVHLWHAFLLGGLSGPVQILIHTDTLTQAHLSTHVLDALEISDHARSVSAGR